MFIKYSTHNYIIGNIGRNKTVLGVGYNEGYIGKNFDKTNIFDGIDYLEESIKRVREGCGWFDLRLTSIEWVSLYLHYLLDNILNYRQKMVVGGFINIRW